MSPPGRPIRVLVVDDSADLAEVLALSIRGEQDMELAGVLHAADGLVDAIRRDRPHVAIVDLTMSGRPPLDAIRQASADHPDTRTIVYSGYDDEQTVDRAVDAGAWGFVSKHADMDAVLDAVRRVADGETVIER